MDDHPANLFTLLGPHYDVHVAEPLTDLCPEALCPPERAGAAAWYGAVLADLTVVYLHAVLPDDVAAGLPPVTQGWHDFAEDDLVGRWNERRVQDRRETAARFIDAVDGISDAGRPALHFLHSLLPHEPWIHLPTGQRHSLRSRIIGAVRDHWRDDAWAVTLEYQRHLLQVQFADSLLGELVQRLRAVGLYDDALVVATADHGASLRPGMPFRLTTGETFAEIAAVPLIVKRPGQRDGRVSAENVETVDILPTVAAEIGLRLPWNPDGTNLFSEHRPARPGKSMFRPGESRMHGPGDLRDAVADAVAHKLARFASGDPTRPRLGLHDDLVGAAVTELVSGRPAGFEVIVDESILLHDIEPDAEFLPAHITGGVVGSDSDVTVPPLAIALNGVVAAVTRTYSFRAFGHATPWEVIVDPRRFAPGFNDIRVFAVRGGPNGLGTAGRSNQPRLVAAVDEPRARTGRAEPRRHLVRLPAHAVHRTRHPALDHRRGAPLGPDRPAVSAVRTDRPDPDDRTAEAVAAGDQRVPAVRRPNLRPLGANPSARRLPSGLVPRANRTAQQRAPGRRRAGIEPGSRGGRNRARGRRTATMTVPAGEAGRRIGGLGGGADETRTRDLRRDRPAF